MILQYDGRPDSEIPGFDSLLRLEFFRIVNCHISNPLLHLVANVFSKLKMYRTCFLLRGVNVTVIRCPWRSNSYDAYLNSERLGFNPLFLIVTYPTHCYTLLQTL